MKKKIGLLISMLVSVICLTACGAGNAEAEYDEAQIEQVTDFLIGYCAEADEMTLDQWKDMPDFSVNLQLTEAGLPFDAESFLSVLDSWQAGIDECGEYIEHGDFDYKVTNGKTEAAAKAKFEKRDGTITFMFDREGNLESMTVSADMETGEILKKAGLNTVLGMGTVFSVLILIAFIIYLFKFIPGIQAMFSGKAKEEPENVRPEPETSVTAETMPETSDDGELIAVIAAAIAAAEAENGNADGFVVRSIRRRPSNKWR